MKMTSKERILTALSREIPDRLPATIHQWQDYHLKNYMGGQSALEAFRDVGLDASITLFIPSICFNPDVLRTKEWKYNKKPVKGKNLINYHLETPEREMTFQIGYDDKTNWATDHLIKNDNDIYLLKKYLPVPKIDKKLFEKTYDQIGDDGILRTLVFGDQAGCWQDACVLYGTEQMIFATFDKPDWVHEFLNILLEKKLQFIEMNFPSLKVDLIETGGGASSNNVISPKIHEEFCLPYDKKMHDAIHDSGHKAVYHTCGGMTKILDLILENHCDASETLSPPGVGGDITEPDKVKSKLGKQLALIGGMDQSNILGSKPEDIRVEVKKLFKVYGKNGGYIISACDHFFDDVSRKNLLAYAEAARECVY